MSRPLKLSIMLALALGTTGVLAQSLGQIQVKSNLDQPLLAEVPLLSQTAGDTRNVQVSLASAEAYGRAGVDRAGVPAGLQFAVVNNAQGQAVIRITSTAPVSEPYIDLLLDVKGGSGSVVREVTLLLDPANAPAPAVAAPRSPAAAPASATPAPRATAAAAVAPATPAPRAERTERPEPARHAASSAGSAPAGSFPAVQKGQTLSVFAKQLAGHGGDMNQALVALQKANPDAFYRDNMNALKAGAVLRVPAPADVSGLSAAEASSQVRRQAEDWRGGAARAPSAVADAAAGNAPTGKATGKTAEDRLALVPAKGGDSSATRAGVADGKSQAALASLRQELARSQESLTALQQQGDELKSRVNDLEGINEKNQRLLSLKDNEIAELQHKLADARKAANLPPVAPVAAASVARAAPAPAPAASVAKAATAATPPVAAASAPVPAGSAVLTTTPLAEAKPAAPVAAAPKPAPRIAPPAPVPQDDAWYMQPIVWGGAAVVVIALALLAASRRRRKPAAAVVAAPSLADRFGDDPMFAEEHAVTHAADEDDVDQRELLDELSEHPDDVGLHLELVSLYYDRRDVDHFEAAAEAMYAHVTDADQAEWQEVVHMGEDLTPQHPLFAHGPALPPLPPQTDDEHAALEAFDISRYAGTSAVDDELPPVPVAPVKHSEYHFNFDLSPRQSAVTDRAADAARQSAEPFDEAPAFETQHAHVVPVDHAVQPPELPAYDAAEEESSTWKFDEPAHADTPATGYDSGVDEFSDDPVDTKLDLARAYLDMGDHDGARAMLEEVAHEGTQMQQDVARRMLSDLT
jgi:pilus assembly protein FimV